jgi:hypothetical protein
MRIGLAIGALTAGFFAATVPAAAQGWGYTDGYGPGAGVSVGFGGPAYYGAYAAAPGYYAPGYAYSAPGACSCAGPAYGYRGAYAYQPGYAYRSTYADEPGYVASGHAYEPGYAPAYESETYSYSSGPRYVSRGSRVVARGEFRENTRSATVTREQRPVRTRSSDVAVRERTNGVGVRGGQTVRGEATVGQGGEMRNATSTRASAQVRGEPSARGGELRGRSRGAGEPGPQ